MTTNEPRVDVLSDALRALRVVGMVLLREVYSPPFKVAVPSAIDLASRLHVLPGARVVAFHLAEFGSFELRRDSAEVVLVGPGESVFCFGGQSHCLAQGETAQIVDFASLLESEAACTFGAASGVGADQVQIICGALVLHDTQLNPLFSSLPDVLHVRRGVAGEPGRVGEFAALLCSELEREDPAAEYVVERLLEVLCAEGIRRFAAEQSDMAGWFHGLADSRVNRALAAFHALPGRPWSIGRLAQVANLSASRFGARFTAATGGSVMVYVARWRMNLAMRALSGTEESIATIAGRMGYDSLPAFSRAFKRHVGLPPAAYRARPARPGS
jgi:AraC-like DNA-binding protein